MRIQGQLHVYTQLTVNRKRNFYVYAVKCLIQSLNRKENMFFFLILIHYLPNKVMCNIKKITGLLINIF